jgi:hypothetical protein
VLRMHPANILRDVKGSLPPKWDSAGTGSEPFGDCATAPRAISRSQNIQTRLGKLDNEGRFVVNFVFPALPTQFLVSHCSIFQDSVANVPPTPARKTR